MPQPLHLYVHWPWCKAKCPYCDFNSHAMPEGTIPTALRQQYIAHVMDEIHFWRHEIAPGRPIGSVFFGGGTPSLMRADEVGQIIDAARKLGAWQPTTEVTLECNPTSLEEDCGLQYFHELKNTGVTRLSIGVQGLRDEWLQFLGRHHNATGALQTLQAAQQVFKRVNADVIYGLPNQRLADWKNLLNQLAELNLSHISAYQLTVERNTAFWGQVRRKEWQPVDSDKEADFYEATAYILAQRGYENYEISNFAKPGQACRHNLGVWQGEDYIGVGAGAHGRITTHRGDRLMTATRKLPEAYVAADSTAWERFVVNNPLIGPYAIQEAFLLGLRLKTGVCLTRLLKIHSETSYAEAIDTEELSHFIANDLLETADTDGFTFLRLTTRGWSVLNMLLSRLLRPLNLPKSPHPSRVQILNSTT